MTNAQQSIMQSSNITEILFDTHNKFWEKVLNDAIDLAVRIADREVVHILLWIAIIVGII